MVAWAIAGVRDESVERTQRKSSSRSCTREGAAAAQLGGKQLDQEILTRDEVALRLNLSSGQRLQTGKD